MSAAATPRHLLLATDLSARCDRARDRSLSLARLWGAKLTVVHAHEEAVEVPRDKSSLPASRTAGDAILRAARLLRADFRDVEDVEVNLRPGKGRPEDVVLDIAAEEGCDLIVTGIAGNDPAGQFILGSTVRSLTRRAAVPVLVVKKRLTGPYQRVTVASDLSDASAATLKTAMSLFPPENLTLFHAFDTPFRNWTDDKAAYESERRRAAIKEVGLFLRNVAGEDAESIRIDVEHGDPVRYLAEQGLEEIDLAVAGSHGRTALASVLLGSIATAILDQAPCDVMIVPSKGIRTGA